MQNIDLKNVKFQFHTILETKQHFVRFYLYVEQPAYGKKWHLQSLVRYVWLPLSSEHETRFVTGYEHQLLEKIILLPLNLLNLGGK